MRLEKEHEVVGKIEYSESFWTGRRQVTVNGVVLNRINNKQFEKDDIKATVMGSMISGLVINVNGTYISMCNKSTPLEYILAFIPLVLIIIWGNSIKLCSIVPVVGGMLGGAISGGCGACALIFMKLQKNTIGKIVVALIALVASFVLCFIVGSILASALK